MDYNCEVWMRTNTSHWCKLSWPATPQRRSSPDVRDPAQRNRHD